MTHQFRLRKVKLKFRRLKLTDSNVSAAVKHSLLPSWCHPADLDSEIIFNFNSFLILHIYVKIDWKPKANNNNSESKKGHSHTLKTFNHLKVALTLLTIDCLSEGCRLPLNTEFHSQSAVCGAEVFSYSHPLPSCVIVSLVPSSNFPSSHSIFISAYLHIRDCSTNIS